MVRGETPNAAASSSSVHCSAQKPLQLLEIYVHGLATGAFAFSTPHKSPLVITISTALDLWTLMSSI